VLQPPASIFALSIRNIHRPGFPTLDCVGRLITWWVRDPGTLKNRLPSPALKPACQKRATHQLTHDWLIDGWLIERSVHRSGYRSLGRWVDHLFGWSVCQWVDDRLELGGQSNLFNGRSNWVRSFGRLVGWSGSWVVDRRLIVGLAGSVPDYAFLLLRSPLSQTFKGCVSLH